MLFVELMLIRWGTAHVIYIALFANFVLIASFLGIGIGFLRCRRPRDGSRLAPALLLATVGFIELFQVGLARADGRSLQGTLGLPALPSWVLLSIAFCLVTAT